MQYSFSERMQRISKNEDIQNIISLASDKELNILIYWTPSYVITYLYRVTGYKL